MKKSLCFLLVLLVSFKGLGQQSFYKYCNSNSFDGYFYGVAETDSGYLAVGTVGIVADHCLNFTDYTGQLIKQVLFNTPSLEDGFNTIISSNSGGALALGGINATLQDPKSYTSVVQFDASANVLWSKKIVGSTQVSLSDVICNRHGYFVGGGTWEMDPYNVDLELMVFDSAGVVLHQKSAFYFDSTNFQSGGDMVRDIVETDDGGYVFLCSYDNDPTQSGYNPQVYLYKTDSALNYVWSTSVPTNLNCQGFEIVEKANGNLLFSSTIDSLGFNDMKAVLTELSSSGTFLWRKSYDIVGLGNFQPSCLLLNSDSTIICQTSVDGYLILFEVDDIGNVNWSNKYLNQFAFTPSAMTMSSDNGLLIPGGSGSFPLKPELLKLSSGGSTFCSYSPIFILSNSLSSFQSFGMHSETNTSYAMIDITMPELVVNSWVNICGATNIYDISGDKQIVFYPNPVIDVAYIKIDGFAIGNLSVSIFNPLGQNVAKFSNLKSNELELDLSKLKKGIYIAQIVDENDIIGNVKFIVR